MNDTSISRSFSIRHEPLGEQHPYEPLPWKRNSRFLTSGDPVILCPPFKVLIDQTDGFSKEQCFVQEIWQVKEKAIIQTG